MQCTDRGRGGRSGFGWEGGGEVNVGRVWLGVGYWLQARVCVDSVGCVVYVRECP